MNYRLFLLIAFLSVIISSNSQTSSNGFTDYLPSVHGLIIGISDYRNISDLNYADDDALAFRDYLLNTMDNKADSNNISVYLNEDAISSTIYTALESLVSQVEEKDKVYVYFSGHGDSENATIFKSGFLLTYDTPKDSYYSNSVNIDILNNFISTLSIKNKAEVVFIIDACHSGSLGNEGSNGARVVSNALAESVAKEVRMLSCQPDEVSLEGEQWGNGRGLFSYHLINGLLGLADAPNMPDGKVSLNELNIYLSTYVPKDAQPVKQYPGIYGPMSKHLSNVDAAFVEQYINNQVPLIAKNTQGINSKGYQNKYIDDLDTQQLLTYNKFLSSLVEIESVKNEEKSAIDYYEELLVSNIDANFASLLEYELIAKLQEDPQLYINDLLTASKNKEDKRKYYVKWASNLALAAKLLGEEHPLHNSILSKSYFMKAISSYSKISENMESRNVNKYALAAIKNINIAIEMDSLVTFYHNLKGAVLNKSGNYSSAIRSFRDAVAINENYPYSYCNMGYSLMNLGDNEKAIDLCNKTIELDSTYPNAYIYKSQALKKTGRIKESVEVLREMTQNMGNKAKF